MTSTASEIRRRTPDDAPRWRLARHSVFVLYAATAALATLQRGVFGPQHTTFKIFRQSFWHLLRGVNLYAPYPLEQGTHPADLFKYSPTAALLFAPFAVVPYTPALLLWSLLNAFLLLHALERLLPRREAVLAAILVYPDLLAAMQACSSNALVAALIVLAFVALERGEQLRGAIAIAAGAAIKLFPLAALSFAVLHHRRRRFALVCVAVAAAVLVLPLLVTSPARLVQQYHWWSDIERSDAADLLFGLSLMRMVRSWIGGSWPNWPLQVAGTVVVLLPVLLRRAQWADADFRRHYLASLLAYVLLFNHQAERATFVVGSTGVAIWAVSFAGAVPRAARVALAVLALIGLGTLPLAVVWLTMEVELFLWPLCSASPASKRTRDARRGDAISWDAA